MDSDRHSAQALQPSSPALEASLNLEARRARSTKAVEAYNASFESFTRDFRDNLDDIAVKHWDLLKPLHSVDQSSVDVGAIGADLNTERYLVSLLTPSGAPTSTSNAQVGQDQKWREYLGITGGIPSPEGTDPWYQYRPAAVTPIVDRTLQSALAAKPATSWSPYEALSQGITKRVLQLLFDVQRPASSQVDISNGEAYISPDEAAAQLDQLAAASHEYTSQEQNYDGVLVVPNSDGWDTPDEEKRMLVNFIIEQAYEMATGTPYDVARASQGTELLPRVRRDVLRMVMLSDMDISKRSILSAVQLLKRSGWLRNPFTQQGVKASLELSVDLENVVFLPLVLSLMVSCRFNDEEITDRDPQKHRRPVMEWWAALAFTTEPQILGAESSFVYAIDYNAWVRDDEYKAVRAQWLQYRVRHICREAREAAARLGNLYLACRQTSQTLFAMVQRSYERGPADARNETALPVASYISTTESDRQEPTEEGRAGWDGDWEEIENDLAIEGNIMLELVATEADRTLVFQTVA